MRVFRPCRCATCVLRCAQLSSCVHVPCADFILLRAAAHKGAVVAAGALPALVLALASSTSEATREHCAGAIRNVASSGAWCCQRLAQRAPWFRTCSAWLQLHGCTRCRLCRCACGLNCARSSCCVHVSCILTSYSCAQRLIGPRLSLQARCPRWCQRWRRPCQRRRGSTARLLWATFRLAVRGAACASAPLIQACSGTLRGCRCSMDACVVAGAA